MLGNGIEQTTNAAGTGVLTLAAVAGCPTIAQALGIGTPVSYCIVKKVAGVPLFVEAGIGYLSAASTFVRARVSATYVAGAYANVNPAPANLTEAHHIIVTPHAGTVESVPATLDAVSSGIGRMLTSGNRTAQTAAGILTMNRLVYVPFLMRNGGLVTSLSINITTPQPLLTAQAGIYACGPDGYIGKLLASVSGFDCSTTGLKTITLAAPIFLPPGQYFTGVLSTGAAANGSATVYANSNPSVLLSSPYGFVAGGVVPIDARYETLASGASLPVTPSPATTHYTVGSSATPVVFVGVE